MPAFSNGDRVSLKANPERVGIVDQIYEDSGATQYDVFFTGTETRTFPEAALIAPGQLQVPAGPIEMLKRWQLGDAEQFRAFLTLAKLSSPIANNLYSFLASRTELLPYQFKPVLKLIESPYPRMLIADEVGLGKTIEAGIILTELNARAPLNRVLIVCPSSLLGKWRNELRDRFEWDFAVHDGASLRKELKELQHTGERSPFRGIASLELLRREENLEALDEAKPRFDAVVVDEAHHMRNSYTKSNALGAYLSTLTETMVFLTATPLNLGERDFFELLQLLVPEEFNDFGIFQELLEPNEPINSALRQLRSMPPDFGAAAKALKRVEGTSQGGRFKRNVVYTDAVARLEQAASGALDETGREWRINTQRMLAELNTLSHVFTRTKKREVQEHFPTRRAHKLEIEFSEPERRFYDAVTRWADVSYSDTDVPVAFVRISVQRQAASSIFGMGQRMEEMLGLDSVRFLDEELIDLEDEAVDLIESSTTRHSIEPSPGVAVADPLAAEELDVTQLEAELPELAKSKLITEVANAWRDVKAAGVDTKFDVLREQLESVFAHNSDAKVLIFSFFIRTIDHLEERLSSLEVDGRPIGVRKIYGATKPEDRHQVISDFRTATGPQVLISSEVGAEGLDFQFCSTMVNYDLPWNPMRVEQRIGRLDRYGQQADLIEIFNLVIADSIEDRIFYRLYDRIEIFKRAIGDLEAILGNEVGELQRDLMTRDLTLEEQERRANQIADAILNLEKEHEHFDEQSKKFVGVDEVFTERFNDIRQGERYITPAEIKNFVEGFLSRRFPSVRLKLAEGVRSSIAEVFELSGSENSAFIEFLNDAYYDDPTRSKDFYRLITRLQLGERCALTFDGRAAMIDRGLEFFSIHHPIVRAIVKDLESDPTLIPPTGGLSLSDDVRSELGIASGPRLFFLFEVTIRAQRDEIQLEAVALQPDSTIDEALSSRFLSVVGQASSLPAAAAGDVLADEVIERCAARARQWAGGRVESIQTERSRVVESAVETQLESLRLSHRRRVARIRGLLADAEAENQVSIARMRRGELTNVERNYEEKTRELQDRTGVEVSHRVVGAGLVSVGAVE